MRTEKSSVIEEIQEIFDQGVKPVNHTWECKIINPNGEHIPQKLISIDVHRDYLKGFSDETVVTVQLGEGFYSNEIIKYKDQLQIELTRTPVKELSEVSKEDDVQTRLYRAIVMDTGNERLQADKDHTNDQETDDLVRSNRKSFQLVGVAVDQLKIMEYGGIFENVIPGDVMRYALTTAVGSIRATQQDTVAGIDVVGYDNMDKSKHVVIPHGTPIRDIAKVIQTDWGGIYNTDIGSYVQDNLWYIWPLYKTNRYPKEIRPLRIYNIPQDKLPGVERTYRLNGYELIVISTGEATFNDLSYIEKINFGNGLRYTNADKIMSGFDTVVNTDKNKYIIDKSNFNTEMRGFQWNDGEDYAPVSPARITNNSFVEASRLAPRMGSFMQMVWEQSNVDLIYPGMPTKVLYLDGDELKEIHGVVVGTHHYIEDTAMSITGTEVKTTTSINVFIERIEEWRG